MKKIYFLLSLLILTACSNKIVVHNYSGKESIENKFFYTLPANTIDVECKIKKEVYTRGGLFPMACSSFIKIAVDSFGLDEKILNRLLTNKELTDHSLLKDGFSWSLGAVPDSNKLYIFESKPSILKDNSFTFSFNRDWTLGSATVSSENKTFEIVTTFLSSLISTATGILKGSTKDPYVEKASEACTGLFKPLLKAKKEYQNFLLSPPPLEAEGLQLSKTARLKIIEKMIEDIFYKKEEEISVIRFSLYVPATFATNTTMKFFKIDKPTGQILINNALETNIVWPKPSNKITPVIPLDTDAGYYTISSLIDPFSVENKLSKSRGLRTNTSSGEESGIVYNVPKIIRFYLRDDKDNILANTVFPIAQLGSVNTLSQKISKADFVLDSLTGSLTKITMESKSLATGNITTPGNILQQVDSSFKKLTEVEKLEKEIKELELRAKKKELLEKLQ